MEGVGKGGGEGGKEGGGEGFSEECGGGEKGRKGDGVEARGKEEWTVVVWRGVTVGGWRSERGWVEGRIVNSGVWKGSDLGGVCGGSDKWCCEGVTVGRMCGGVAVVCGGESDRWCVEGVIVVCGGSDSGVWRE